MLEIEGEEAHGDVIVGHNFCFSRLSASDSDGRILRVSCPVSLLSPYCRKCWFLLKGRCFCMGVSLWLGCIHSLKASGTVTLPLVAPYPTPTKCSGGRTPTSFSMQHRLIHHPIHITQSQIWHHSHHGLLNRLSLHNQSLPPRPRQNDRPFTPPPNHDRRRNCPRSLHRRKI